MLVRKGELATVLGGADPQVMAHGGNPPRTSAARLPARDRALLTPTVHGMIHSGAAFIGITSLAVACVAFAVRFAGEPHWHLWSLYAVAAGVLTMIFIAAFGSSLGHGPAGLFERTASGVQGILTLALVARLLLGTGYVSSRRLPVDDRAVAHDFGRPESLC